MRPEGVPTDERVTDCAIKDLALAVRDGDADTAIEILHGGHDTVQLISGDDPTATDRTGP